jgi:hypothetical protein
VQPTVKSEQVKVAKLTRGQEIGDRIGLAPLTTGQYVHLRQRYLNVNIKAGTPGVACAVLVDGYLVGVFGYETSINTTAGVKMHAQLPQPEAYLLSDFAVVGTDYPRLSKLIVLAAMSREARYFVERAKGQRVRSLSTTAFAKNPVSMKYRGLLDLLDRHDRDEADGGGFKLVYGGLLGEHSLAEAFDTWRERWGTRKEPVGA